MNEPAPLNLVALDSYLAPPHREDDEPCNCDECMAYGAEDNGVDWYRLPVATRIVMRIRDGADSRFAELATAFDQHAIDMPLPDAAPDRMVEQSAAYAKAMLGDPPKTCGHGPDVTHPGCPACHGLA